MPYTQTWKSWGFKKNIVYGYYCFSSVERRYIEMALKKRYGQQATFCTGDTVEFV